MLSMKYENEHVIFWFEEGILMGTYKDEVITEEIARSVVEFRKEVSNQKSYPGLISSKSIFKITKEARDYLSSDEGVEGVIAGALVIDSLFQATLSNFFLKVTSPKLPSKIFTSKPKAISWLSQFVANG